MGGLLGTSQDVLAVYQTNDNAKKAVDSYMDANKDESDPKVLPSVPAYMNKWLLIGGSILGGLIVGTVIYKIVKKKSLEKKRHETRRIAA